MFTDAATDQALLTAAWVQTIASLLSIVLAIGGIVLAYLGIRIARTTAKGQIANRSFASDQSHADTFVATVEGIEPHAFLTGEPSENPTFKELSTACEKYAQHVSDAGLGVSMYFKARQGKIYQRMIHREFGSSYDPGADVLAINAQLIDIVQTARSWVYPERRGQMSKKMEPIILDWWGPPQGPQQPTA